MRIRIRILIVIIGFISSCGNRATSVQTVSNAGVDQDTSHKELIRDSSKKESSPEISEITCPKCGYKKVETLPTEVCQLAYTCGKCGEVMHPKDGDCCVFCTYGDQKCPSKQ